jgi:hypothetical protein
MDKPVMQKKAPPAKKKNVKFGSSDEEDDEEDNQSFLKGPAKAAPGLASQLRKPEPIAASV